MDFLAFPLEVLPYAIITIVIAFSVHEFAHAYVAYLFGDDTAKRQGRLTLNPVSHIEPIGAILILLFGFGWARPVPVNRFFFKNPRLAGVLVSLAGPISNLLLALIGLFVWQFLANFLQVSYEVGQMINEGFSIFVSLNVTLFVFNLIPLPPLDGYRIIEDLAPRSLRPKLTDLEKYGAFIFLLLVLTPLSNYTIQPIFRTVIPAVYQFLNSAVDIVL